MADKKKTTPTTFTHWGRPNWLRMYEYNYEYGESYYRNQVKYISTSRYSSESNSEMDTRKAYLQRRRAAPPPRAMSFIERWSDEPFYGLNYGYGLSRSARAESRTRELSQHKSSIETSDMRSRRAQSEFSRLSTAAQTSSNYASQSLLSQMKSVKSSSIAVQQESASYEQQVRSRRARSVEASMTSGSYGFSATNASDDCLMRSDAMRSRRERSESRFSREGSLTKNTLAVEDNMMKGKTSDGSTYEYPRHHLVCTEKCPMFTDPVHHRRFVIGNKFGDAAALGGFDVLYDPSVYKKTRQLLQRFSQERQIEATIYESSRETESQSRGIFQYSR